MKPLKFGKSYTGPKKAAGAVWKFPKAKGGKKK